jgi:tetratricopeptide (TPR) repeat protein
MTALQKFIATIVVLAAVGAGIYFVVTKQAQSTGMASGDSTMSTSTSTATSQNKPTLVTPDYKKPIKFSATVTPEIKVQLNTSLKAAQAKIAENPLNMGAWTTLGTLHKMGGDYAVALEYWDYVTSVYQGVGTPYYSIGDLYDNFLNDNAKAEENYLLAIKVNSKNVNAYASLYTLYHFELKNDTKAAAILAQGLKANPGNNYLLSLQQELTQH